MFHCHDWNTWKVNRLHILPLPSMGFPFGRDLHMYQGCMFHIHVSFLRGNQSHQAATVSSKFRKSTQPPLLSDIFWGEEERLSGWKKTTSKWSPQHTLVWNCKLVLGSIFQRADQFQELGIFRHNKPSRNCVLLWESKPIWED